MRSSDRWICFFVYFTMFPLGFQVSKVLELWLNGLNEQASGLLVLFLWIFVSGVLAAVFLLVMLILHRQLLEKYPSCRWLSIAICVLHLALGMFTGITMFSQVMFQLFGYMFVTKYMVLLVMLLTFLVADLLLMKGVEKK